jgi:hypothetical protein
MPRKKIVQKQPIEKLSSDAIVEITEDSSSDEEDNVPMIKPVKKPRTAKQLANDQRLRDRKKKVIEPVNELDSTTHPVKPVPVAIDEDKPLTKKEMFELMAEMNQPKPVVKKPRKPRASKADMAARKSEKIVKESTLTPPVRTKPELLFV